LDKIPDICIDLGDGSLNGVKIGDDISKINQLTIFNLENLGLSLFDKMGIIVGTCIGISKMKSEKPFRGILSYNGAILNISSNTTMDYISQFMGEPANSWDDDVEMCQMYENGKIEWEFLWKSKGHLQYINCDMNYVKRKKLLSNRRRCSHATS